MNNRNSLYDKSVIQAVFVLAIGDWLLAVGSITNLLKLIKFLKFFIREKSILPRGRVGRQTLKVRDEISGGCVPNPR